MSKDQIDLHRVLIEIEEEVRAKRASGELPASMERELDLVFARLAPPGAVEGDFEQLLDRAQSQSFFDLVAPNESVRPGVPHVKRVVQKTVRWYMRYVIEQVAGFANTITKATRQLDERVRRVEQLTAPSAELAALRLQAVVTTNWDDLIAKALSDVEGRVLHAGCGSGSLVKKLHGAGIDAYGVDPASELIAIGTADSAGLDLRPDDERSHLEALAPGVLAGLVFTGNIDVMARGQQIQLIDLASVVLRQGGVLVVESLHPRAWENSRSPVEVDLAPGRPMHVETWQHLLEDRGFSDITIERAGNENALVHVKDNKEMNENLDRLNAVLFPPPSSLLVARR